MKHKIFTLAAASILLSSWAFADNLPCNDESDCILAPVFAIQKNVTIKVPGRLPFLDHKKINTIQDALKALDNKKISNNATVTIMLTNNATNYDSIVINNPDANKINIIGNCNSGPCTIQFKSGANGIVADKGNTLGLLDNFNLIGQKTPSTNGILAIQKSSIICGSHITVQQFENGLQAIYGSYIAAPYVVSQYNLKNGITVFNGSTAYVPHANVNHNGDKGIIAWGTSNIEATDAIAQYNYDGIFSDGNSLIDARRSVADNNDHWGMRASLGAVIGAENTRASNNASSGFEAIFNALIFAPSATAQNNNPNVNEEQQGQVWGVQVNQAKK